MKRYRNLSKIGCLAIILVYARYGGSAGVSQVYLHASYLVFVALITQGLIRAGQNVVPSFASTALLAYLAAVLDRGLDVDPLGAAFSFICSLFYIMGLSAIGEMAFRATIPSAPPDNSNASS